ncbi:MAG: helicase associated domain-containing protein, partial [Candidatus Peribacteraceae bacterium]
RWLHRMRAKLRNGKLSEAEAEALRGLGVEPAEKKEDIEKTFDERIEELRSWRSEHPDEWPKNDSSLGWWLHKMRVKLRNGKLSEAEADALTALGVKPAKKRGH